MNDQNKDPQGFFMAAFSEFIIQQTVDRMVRENYMDDERIARLAGASVGFVQGRRRALRVEEFSNLAAKLGTPGMVVVGVALAILLVAAGC